MDKFNGKNHTMGGWADEKDCSVIARLGSGEGVKLPAAELPVALVQGGCYMFG